MFQSAGVCRPCTFVMHLVHLRCVWHLIFHFTLMNRGRGNAAWPRPFCSGPASLSFAACRRPALLTSSCPALLVHSSWYPPHCSTQALLVVGFAAHEFERLQRLLHEEMEAEMVKVGAPCMTAWAAAAGAAWCLAVMTSLHDGRSAWTATLAAPCVARGVAAPAAVLQLVPASAAMLEGSLGAALEQEPVPPFEQVLKGGLL